MSLAYAPRLSPGHTIVQDVSQLDGMVRAMRTARQRAVDFETSGVRFADGQKPIGAALGFLEANGAVRAWYVPTGHHTMEAQIPEDKAKLAFADALDGAEGLVGQNLGFDLNMGRAAGWKIPEWVPIHDTAVQAWLINEDRLTFQLEALVNSMNASPYEGGAYGAKKMLDGFLKSRAKEHRMPLKKSRSGGFYGSYLGKFGHVEVPVAMEGEYACRDIGHALVLDWRQRHLAQGQHLPHQHQAKAASLYEYEMLLVRALADMSYRGQLVDADYLGKLAIELDAYLDLKGRELESLFGVRLRWGNDSDVRDLLYTALKLPVIKRTARGDNPSTDKATLMALAHLHPGIPILADWRAHYKVRTTYTDSLLDKVCRDGRIHPSFVQWGTDSGRLSSRDPNFQNIPSRHKKLATMVRQAFLVDPGRARVLCDYSQIELRVLAWTTGCKNLLAAYASPAYDLYRAGKIDYDTYRWMRRSEPTVDVHGRTAQTVFGAVPAEEGSAGYAEWYVKRSASKIINFGVPYGGGPGLLSGDANLQVPPDKAKAFHEQYHRKNPEIEASKHALYRHMRRTFCPVAKTPYFVNWAGLTKHGRRLTWRRKSGGSCPVSEEERSVFACLIQGGAAMLTRFSLVKLWWAQKTGKMPGETTSSVHDEIAVDCDRAHVPYVASETQRIMEDFKGTFGPTPVIADLEVTTTTWADKKGYDFWSTT